MKGKVLTYQVPGTDFVYHGLVDVDLTNGILYGHVVNIPGAITFQSESIGEIEKEFHRSVEDYLEFCEEVGEAPARPYSGQLLLRTTPEIHRNIYTAARINDSSMNEWMTNVLAEAAEIVLADPSMSNYQRTDHLPAVDDDNSPLKDGINVSGQGT